MTPDQFNAYVSWVIYAVVGKTREADALLKAHRPDVIAGAVSQREAFPIDVSVPLYRGFLLEPELLTRGSISADPRLQSVSFTEDLACAQYFADPEADISAFVHKIRPRAEGYVIEHRASPEDTILFHHSWTNIKLPDSYRGGAMPHLPLAPLAKVQVGRALAAQLRWHLAAQREVILLQRGEALAVKPRAAYPSPPTSELNLRFTPPNTHTRIGESS